MTTSEAIALEAAPVAAETALGELCVRRRKVTASAWAIAIAAVPFFAVLWNFGMRPLRTAVPGGYFANLYDLQARAILRGDLAIPDGLLGIEAFRRDGHEYLYFGPLPALLRVPVLALTEAYDGRLTALSMSVAWLTAAGFTALLPWRVVAMVSPRQVGRVELAVVGAFVALTAGGSPLLFLAAMPWVYSEALLWAAAFSLGTIFAALGLIEQPSRWRVATAGGCVLGGVLSRPTAGWSSGLIIVAIGVVLAVGTRRDTTRRWAMPTVLAGLAPIAMGVVINWAKFRHPFLIPFDSQVWTDLSSRRQEVLAHGGVDSVRFLPSTLWAYLRPDGVAPSATFPFVSAPVLPPRPVGDVVLDMSYRTPSVTATMPLQFVLALLGTWRVWHPGAASVLKRLRVLQAGALIMVGGVLLVGYIAPRYLAEFVPFLTLSAGVGLATTLDRRSRFGRRHERTLAAIGTALGAFGAATCLAIGATMARVGTGGPSLGDFVAAQQWISDRGNGAFDDLVATGDEVPRWSTAGTIYVVGDCRAVYYGTGEPYEPWVPIELAGITMQVVIGQAQGGRDEPGSQSGTLELLRYTGHLERSIHLEFDGNGRYRMVLDGAGQVTEQISDWREPVEGFPISVWVSADLEKGGYLVASPGHLYTFVNARSMEADLRTQFGMFETRFDSTTASRLGVSVTIDPDPASGFCASLVDR